jgi:hypothetical protein
MVRLLVNVSFSASKNNRTRGFRQPLNIRTAPRRARRKISNGKTNPPGQKKTRPSLASGFSVEEEVFVARRFP